MSSEKSTNDAAEINLLDDGMSAERARNAKGTRPPPTEEADGTEMEAVSGNRQHYHKLCLHRTLSKAYRHSHQPDI